MRLEKVQAWFKEREYPYTYTEEDGLGSLDFEYRGLTYHIWEFPSQDGEACGVETNLFHAGKSEDIEGDYEKIIVEELNADFH